MTIKQLKQELDKFNENMLVEVQFRDSGGEYIGSDSCIYLIKKKNNILLL